MTTLIFDTKGRGHHIEYIHHLYMYAGTEATRQAFVFVLSPEFDFMYAEREFPEFPNIRIVTIPAQEMLPLQQASGWKARYREFRLLRTYIRRYRPDRVFLNALVGFMPFLALCPPGKRLVSGILYIIPRRKQGKVPLAKRVADRLRMFLYAHSPAFRRVFLLNDAESAAVYNREFHCRRFRFLPDPFVPIVPDGSLPHLPFPAGKTLFLHFGGMGDRKGTFHILEAIEALSPEAKARCVFVFAGVVSNPDMHRRFVQSIDRLRTETEIHFLEGFIPFNELGRLCQQADYLLVPYKNVEQSSGVIGYAAQFNKPVVGPDKGLLGSLIVHYQLGHALPDVGSKGLAAFFEQAVHRKSTPIDGHRYLQVCHRRNFAQTILNNETE